MLKRNFKNDLTLPFEVGHLPEVFQKKAELELNETPDNSVRRLKEMKELLLGEKSMIHIEFEDNFLVQFLRCEKYDVARALSRLDSFVKLKKNNTDMFTNFSFKETVKTMENDVMTVLPWRCHEGCSILYINLDNWIPQEFPVPEVKRMAAVLILQANSDPMTQVNGFKVIMNAKSSPLRHLRHCTLQNLYLMYHGSQDCAPVQFKEYHLVNQSATSRFALAVITPFLSEDVKRKIFIHSSIEGLYDYFPLSCLPAAYGGDLCDYSMTEWLKKVMNPQRLDTIGGKLRQSLND